MVETDETAETGAGERDPDGELSEFLESRREADRALARRYGHLARAAYGTGLLALVATLVLWAAGVVASSDPLFRILIVTGAVFLVCGVLLAKLAEVVFSRRRSPRRRGSAGRLS